MLETAHKSQPHETFRAGPIDSWNDSRPVEEPHDRAPDFHMMYDEDTMTVEDLDAYGAGVCRGRGFIPSNHESTRVDREGFMLPTPDVRYPAQSGAQHHGCR